MASITISNLTTTNIGLPNPFGVLRQYETRTWTDITSTAIETAGPSLVALQASNYITFDVFTPTTASDAEREVTYANVESVASIASLVVEEFTDPPTADDDYFVTSTATAITATAITAFAASTLTIPREVTISRTADIGSYTTDDIIVEGTLNGTRVLLTFTPLTADGGDVLESVERIGIDTITRVSIPAQVDVDGAFTVGFGGEIGLKYPVKERAGLAMLVHEIEAGAVVTTGVLTEQMYDPGTTPDGSTSYAIVYERA